MEQPKKEYLTVAEAAAVLGLHPNTVRNAIRAGKLTAYKFGDTGKWRIKQTDLENYLKEYRGNDKSNSDT